MKPINTPIALVWACICLLFANQYASAQLTVEGGFTPEQIVEQLVGTGVQVSNITMDCPDISYGTFNGEFSDLGINEGILLTSGDINVAPGPNDSPSVGDDSNPAFDDNDPDLDALLTEGEGTHDACVLEFDLVPYSNTLSFNYVFGSEEYEEFIDDFNDIFAFFISGGSEYPIPVNIALVPGTSTPVSIDNVNGGNPDIPGDTGDNAEYYISNPEGFETTVQYDGFTVVLTATAQVTPCETYHLKIAIADALDSAYDSGVFLQANSLSTNYVEIEASAVSLTSDEVDAAVEGCVNGLITFSSSEPFDTDFPIEFSLSGTAVQGVDYTVPTTTTVIPAGESSVSIPITVLEDNLAEGIESINITFVLDLACGINPIVQNATLNIEDVVPVTVSEDVTLEPGQSTQLTATGGDGSYTWSPPLGLSNPNSANPFATPIQTTTYTATSTIGSCTLSDQVTVTIQTCDPATDPNAGTIQLNSNRICSGSAVNATAAGSALNSPEDVLVFVLHNSATNDLNAANFQLYSWNTTGTFNNDATYPTNTALYITSIAGDDDGSGFPDLTDPCISISPAEEVVFLNPIVITVDEYCDWNAAPNGIFYITVYATGGLPEYEAGATYTMNGDINVSGLLPNESRTQQFEGSTATQQYSVNVSDGNGCNAAAGNTFICFKTAVELVSYTGQATDRGNELKWITASEVESNYYTLSRASNGEQFQTIATIKAAGNSLNTQYYNYTDLQAPIGTAYYKLTQTDNNGTVNDLGTISLTRKQQNGLQIVAIAPVPVTNIANIAFTSENNQNITLNIYDITGRITETQYIIGNGNTQYLPINLSQYAAGTYFVVLNDGKNVASEKIIKK
jgi:hypothetical protein